MTTRICLFGNSHLAALREAWTTDPGRWPGIEARFVGAHKDLLLQTEVAGTVLRPVTAAAQQAFRRLGGVEAVDLSDFDHVVIVGCMVALPQAANTYRDARWPGLPSLRHEPDLAAMPQRLISRAAARAAVAGTIATRLGPRLARRIRPAVPGGLWIASQPRVSAIIKTRPSPVTRSQALALRNGDAPELSALFDEAAARACDGSGARFLPQPRETIDSAILTALPFVEGAKRLTPAGNQPQPPEDIMHANAAYGAAVLDQIAAAIAA